MSVEDLAVYRPVVGPPLTDSLLTVNLTVLSTPAPSGGPFVNYVMSWMDGE